MPPHLDGGPLSNRLTATRLFNLLRTKGGDYWSGERTRRTLNLFKAVATRVPAYKDFLKKNKVDPEKIKTWRDFQFVPHVSKVNYLRQYPLVQLCWDSTLRKPLVFTSTSGSTGAPFYFPRWHNLDWQYSTIIENFLRDGLVAEKGPTLVIICFGMGIWIGGLITYKAFEMAAGRANYPVSIITPGINKGEIFHALKCLAPQFKQIILVGYSPFIKDIVDEAPSQGINLKKINTRFIFAAEAISENLRNYLAQRTGIKNIFVDTLNIYGSADIGAMAFETKISILLKRLAFKSKKLFVELFTQISKNPTLAQYNPLFINFEAPGGEVLLTGDNVLPLVRYSIGDHGGVLTYKEVMEKVGSLNIDVLKEAKQYNIGSIHELPFVYVYERNDFSTKLYGAIIYPEHVRVALQSRSLNSYFTGKFTMITKQNVAHDQYLEINLELKAGIKISKQLEKEAKRLVVKNLLDKNAEYRNNYSTIPQKVTPQLVFWSHEHPLYFKPGVKQKWVATTV